MNYIDMNAPQALFNLTSTRFLDIIYLLHDLPHFVCKVLSGQSSSLSKIMNFWPINPSFHNNNSALSVSYTQRAFFHLTQNLLECL